MSSVSGGHYLYTQLDDVNTVIAPFYKKYKNRLTIIGGSNDYNTITYSDGTHRTYVPMAEINGVEYNTIDIKVISCRFVYTAMYGTGNNIQHYIDLYN